jgi:hypothetical protein
MKSGQVCSNSSKSASEQEGISDDNHSKRTIEVSWFLKERAELRGAAGLEILEESKHFPGP